MGLTLVGVVIGFVLAVGYDLIVSTIRDCRTKKRLRIYIDDRLQFNLDRMNQMVGQLKNNNVPTYLLDASSINNVLSQGHSLFDKQKQKDIDWVRFQFEHINHKLTLLPHYSNLYADILKHVEKEIKAAKRLLGQGT